MRNEKETEEVLSTLRHTFAFTVSVKIIHNPDLSMKQTHL